MPTTSQEADEPALGLRCDGDTDLQPHQFESARFLVWLQGRQLEADVLFVDWARLGSEFPHLD